MGSGAGSSAVAPPPGSVVPQAPTGPLGTAEVAERVRAGKVNVAPPSPGRSVRQILRANVLTRFNAILGTLFVLVLIVGPVQDGLFGIVLVANTTIGVVQELRAKWTLDRLAILTAPRAHVVRQTGGVIGVSDTAVEEIVLDDVLELRPGDQVPVDGTVLTCAGLAIDESLLTGEAEAVAKEVGDEVLSGSFVAVGSGKVRATAVGAASYAARLQARATRFSLVRSELQQGTNTILRLVTWVMVPAGAALVASQLLRTNQSLADAIRGSVAGVGAMVPEGLVLLTSIAFALGAIRLARRRVLVQELASIEGLARTDVLCIDKTGTLTSPEAGVESVVVARGRDRTTVEAALGAMAAADPAPNATMRAIVRSFDVAGGWELTDSVAFSSDRKWSAATFETQGTWLLGAPSILAPELPIELATALRAQEAAGHRVVLAATAAGPVDPDRGLGAVVPVALVVLVEALRDEAVPTIAYLRGQGVSVVVLSGDAPGTVAAVAASAGVPVHGQPQDASGLGSDDEPWEAAVAGANVFGRVRPEQKVAAVRALQGAGHVVAMIGDGVNDVQALKQADLGIAMGSGSQSSRSVARMVLLDDSFAAVPEVLAEGRRVVANIERVARLFVTKTVYAAILAIVIAASGLPYLFFPRHLTIVSTFTIGIPGFFLALAAGAPRAVPGFVARVLAFTVPAGVIAAAGTFVVYLLARIPPSSSAVQQRTAAVLELCALALGVLVLVSRPLNRSRLLLVVAMALCMAVVFVVPVSRRIFAISFPATSVVLGGIVVFAVAMILLVAAERWSTTWVDRYTADATGKGASTRSS